MPTEAPPTTWPFGVEEVGSKGTIFSDERLRVQHRNMVAYRDVLNFDCGVSAPIVAANNITFERVPVIPHGVIVGLKAHSKAPGAGNITLRVNNAGLVVGTITIAGGSTAVVKATPTTNLRTLDTNRISVDCTAVSGVWEWVLVTVIIDPIEEYYG